MFKDEFEMAANGAVAKAGLLKKNPIGYFLLSMLAGAYIGFGILLIFTIGGQLGGAPATKLIMGVSFGIALSLVVICGAELFTGNNLVMTAGVLNKKVSLVEAIKLWIVCYIGNWLGAIVLVLLYHMSGLAN
nr:formate/nitrite transporter family protein [Pseudobutyrivibrio sp.]